MGGISVFFCVLANPLVAMENHSIHLHQADSQAPHYHTFDVKGLPVDHLQQLQQLQKRAESKISRAQWQSVFSVFVGEVSEKDLAQKTSMLGTYQLESETLRFIPQFPLMEGQQYTAVFHHSRFQKLLSLPMANDSSVVEAAPLMMRFQTTQPQRPPTRITQVYPSADVLPENLLRFYIYFSAPMRAGQALQHIHLKNGDNREVPGVFLDTVEELWDPSMTRLTLLFDPGRVKTGLRAHEELGRALNVGEQYRLVIDSMWNDAYGEPLQTSFTKHFRITSADLTPPNVDAWEVSPPPSQTHQSLTLRFPAALDQVLARWFIQIRDAQGQIVRGKAVLDQGETVWRWVPENVWDSGEYSIHVDARLEDIAGNNLYGLFDRPADQAERVIENKSVRIPFQVIP